VEGKGKEASLDGINYGGNKKDHANRGIRLSSKAFYHAYNPHRQRNKRKSVEGTNRGAEWQGRSRRGSCRFTFLVSALGSGERGKKTRERRENHLKTTRGKKGGSEREEKEENSKGEYPCNQIFYNLGTKKLNPGN